MAQTKLVEQEQLNKHDQQENNELQMQCRSSTNSVSVREIQRQKLLQAYSDFDAFAVRYNIEAPYQALEAGDKIFRYKFPRLEDIALAYGPGTDKSWMALQVFGISEYSGVKDKLSQSQLRGLTQVLTIECRFLTIFEILLFFGYLMTGKYGHFYGIVDPMVVMESLIKFKEYRVLELEKIEVEKRHQREAEARKRAISYEEWLKIKDTWKDDEG